MYYMRRRPEPDSRGGKKGRNVKNCGGGGPTEEAVDRRYARNRETEQVVVKKPKWVNSVERDSPEGDNSHVLPSLFNQGR
jgi:hypothetical protein